MLPFMKKKPQVGVIVTTRPADESKQAESESSDLEYCAEDLMNAVHAKDKKGVAEALRSAFTILDSEPHKEGPHTNESEEHAIDEA